jgi:hypothetical protein
MPTDNDYCSGCAEANAEAAALRDIPDPTIHADDLAFIVGMLRTRLETCEDEARDLGWLSRNVDKDFEGYAQAFAEEASHLRGLIARLTKETPDA